MRCVSVCLLAATAAVLGAGVAHAQIAKPAVFAAASAANAKKMSPEQREERRFLKDAAAASRFESEASRMALAKSNDAGVRSFAATLINHHASTGLALQRLLHGRGMAPPMLANDQRKALNRLAKLGGAKFDREYVQEVGLKYQQEDLQVYEKAALAVRDPMLQAWITRTLPTVRYQLATAERLAPRTQQTAPIKVRAPRARPASRPVRQTAMAPGQAAHAELATQFMGAGAMQLGVTQPPAAWPTESSTR